MSLVDDEQPGGGVEASSPRRPDVRKRIAVGAVAAAAVLGAGAYGLTSHLTAKDPTTTRNVGAPAPMAPVSYAAQAPSTSASAGISAAASAGISAAASAGAPAAASGARPAPSTTGLSSKVRQQIDEARAKAAKDGHPLQRALTPSHAADGTISTRMEQAGDATIRITTARSDLTGQRDRLLAADQGHPVGGADCTQKIRFSANAGARVIPNMVVCWRTSATRSVVTMAVGKTKKPSEDASAAIIAREWAKLR